MFSSLTVRPVISSDVDAICDILNHYIENTTINFRVTPQRPEEWLDDWNSHHERYPYLVAEVDSAIVGVAYASHWKLRSAYDWSVETTVYVRAGMSRRGVGSALYRRLLMRLDAQGFRTQIGVIALPNEASVGLHEAMGYRHVGTLEDVGYKMDKWCDVGLFQRMVVPTGTRPGEILPVAAVLD